MHPGLLSKSRKAAVVLNLLSARPEIDGRGNLTEGHGNPYNRLWAPAFCLVGYAWLVLDLLGISSPPGL